MAEGRAVVLQVSEVTVAAVRVLREMAVVKAAEVRASSTEAEEVVQGLVGMAVLRAVAAGVAATAVLKAAMRAVAAVAVVAAAEMWEVHRAAATVQEEMAVGSAAGRR